MWLAANVQGTLEQIARGVTARKQDVREALVAAGDVVAVCALTENRRSAVVYSLASGRADGLGRAGKPALQRERALSILSDGEWHNRAEFVAAGVTCVNSRVADLRARGHRVECKRVGGSYAYRLSILPSSSQER